MTVRRTPDRVWIEGVRGFDAGECASSVHGSQARILETLGESLSYDDLVGYSGFAFRIGIHELMCPSAAHPCCGFPCLDNGTRALPWRSRLFEALPSDRSTADRTAFEAEACAAIKMSIDRGVPVHYGSEEDGLIIGYADEGRRWWCLHPYHERGSEAFWFDEATGFAGGRWPWGIVVWTEPKPNEERVPERELTLSALQQAVEMWKTEKREAYLVGEAAYAHWLRWLRHVESGKAEDPKAGMQGNGWCFDVLIQSRRIAGRWLDQKALGYPEEVAELLRTAAGHFARIADVCVKDLKCSWDLAPGASRYPEWTHEMRQEQITRLEAAREHDRLAVAAIEGVLRALSAG